jgi:hypothetical protein
MERAAGALSGAMKSPLRDFQQTGVADPTAFQLLPPPASSTESTSRRIDAFLL